MKTIYIPIYNYNLYVSIGQRDCDFVSMMCKTKLSYEQRKRIFEEFTVMNCLGRAWLYPNENVEGNKGILILRTHSKIITPYDYSVLAHEIFHVSTFLMRDVEIPLTDDTDECYAYLNDYITEQIYRLFKLAKS